MLNYKPEENEKDIPEPGIVVNTDEIKNEILRREKAGAEHLEEAKALIKELLSADTEDKKAEIERGINLRMNLINQDIQMVEKKPIDEENNERAMDGLKAATELLEAIRDYLSSGEEGFVNYSRFLSLELRKKNELPEAEGGSVKVDEVKRKIEGAIKLADYFGEDEESVKAIARLKSEIGQ